MSTKSQSPVLVLAMMMAAALALSACGSDDEQTTAGATVTTQADEDNSEEEDHDDEEDHSDDDHDDDDHDEDKDHDDDDHDDHDDHDDSKSGLGAHEHGVAELAVAWSGGEMVIDLISPTENIFGFEYEAVTDEDLAVVADRTEALSQPGMIEINAEAGCEPSDDLEVEVEYEGSHAELTASWMLSCDNPDEIAQLDAAGLFGEFPGIEDVDAQWASDAGQSAAELTPSATVLILK